MLCDTRKAKSLTYVEIAKLPRAALDATCRNYPKSHARVREASIKIAIARAMIVISLYARLYNARVLRRRQIEREQQQRQQQQMLVALAAQACSSLSSGFGFPTEGSPVQGQQQYSPQMAAAAALWQQQQMAGSLQPASGGWGCGDESAQQFSSPQRQQQLMGGSATGTRSDGGGGRSPGSRKGKGGRSPPGSKKYKPWPKKEGGDRQAAGGTASDSPTGNELRSLHSTAASGLVPAEQDDDELERCRRWRCCAR